jgi:cell division protein FtsL
VIAAGARVQWNRLGRLAMLFVMVALVFLYLSTGAHMLSTWRQSHRDNATVARMEQEHRRLVGEHNRLSSQSTLEEQARQLGMMRPGEQSYVVGNLPAN